MLGAAGAAAVLLSHGIRWGMPSPRAAIADLEWWMPFIVPITALAAIPVHEALHYIGFRLAGAPRTSIRFGFDPNVGPYCACRAPLRLRGYILAVVLPVIVLGGLPLLLAMGTGRLSITAFSALQVLFAGGDFVALRLALREAGNPWVRDAEHGIGFDVLPDETAPTATDRMDAGRDADDGLGAVDR